MPPKNAPASSPTISALILAAGKGTRMKSTVPKVLHTVMGRPMLSWVMDVVKKAGATDLTLVLSKEIGPFSELLGHNPDLRVAIQSGQRGTGDAVAAACKAYDRAIIPQWAQAELLKGQPSSAHYVLICAGDTPAMSHHTIGQFIAACLGSSHQLGVLGMHVSDPLGYGRLVRDKSGGLTQIVEERDADSEIKKIKLCNSGVVFAEVSWLFKLLQGLVPNNAQNEYYLTDIFEASARQGKPAFVFETSAAAEFAGVNDRAQLANIEKTMMRRRIEEFMAHGVTFHLPDTVYVDGDVVIEPDTQIFPGVCLIGKTRVSRNCVVGPGAVLENTVLGAGVKVGAHAVLVGSSISAGQTISPLASCGDLQV